MKSLMVAAAVIAATATPALAQSTQPTQPTQPMQTMQASTGQAFVTGLLQESRGQIALARLALQRAGGDRARSAAQETITEWTALRARLVPLAYREGAPVRGTLTAAQQAALDRLGRTPESAFDAAYLFDAQRGNEQALARINAAQNSADPGVQRFVGFAKPLVSSYEQMTADDTLGRRAGG